MALAALASHPLGWPVLLQCEFSLHEDFAVNIIYPKRALTYAFLHHLANSESTFPISEYAAFVSHFKCLITAFLKGKLTPAQAENCGLEKHQGDGPSLTNLYVHPKFFPKVITLAREVSQITMQIVNGAAHLESAASASETE